MIRSAEQLPVIVIGGGPVGLTAANLLACAGIDVVVIERHPGTSDDPKAISMDAESLRVLNTFAAGPDLDRVMVPGTGVHFRDHRGRRLFHARDPIPFRHGYAVKSQFAQPELERVLFERLQARPNVELRMSTELVDLRQTESEVEVVVRSVASGGSQVETLRAEYVIGCDGGRSTTRGLCGISMSGRSFDDVWMVVDTIGDDHDERYSIHFGTPGRPHVIVPAADGRCRYEFLLRADEGVRGERPPFSLMQQFLEDQRAIGEEQIERAVNYTFSALVADRWRDGRVFLAGDACHMMPPFAGQGLNSGIRDAANLAWKIAAVRREEAADRLLDTYEQERKPHAEAVVAASVRQGEIMMTTSRVKALLRDAIIRTMLATPAGRRYLEGLRYLPLPHFRSGLVLPGPPALIGRLIDQPLVARADGSMVRLDAELGEGFALLGIETDAEDFARVESELRSLPALRALHAIDVVLHGRRPRSDGPRAALGDVDGAFERLLHGLDGHFLLIRPDRYVAACFRADDVRLIREEFRDRLGTADLLPVPSPYRTPRKANTA